MKTLVKLLLGLAVLAVVLVIGAVVFVAKFLDLNDYKDRIVAHVETQTGRGFGIEGPITHSVYPWLGLQLEGVTLANPPGFGEEPFFQAALMQARVKLLPLLRDEVEMDAIRVHGAAVNLAVDESGHSNWADLVAEPAPAREPFAPASLAIGGVDVKDASLTYANAQAGTRYRVSGLSVQTGALSIGQPIALTVRLDAESAKPALDGRLAVDGTVSYDLGGSRFTLKPFEVSAEYAGPKVPGGAGDLRFTAAVDIDLDQGTATVKELDFNTLDTRVSGTLAASRIDSGAPAMTGELKVTGADLARILRVLEIEPLASEIGKTADRSFDLTTSMEADLGAGDLMIPKLSARLLGASIEGQLKASKIQSEKPALKGVLTARGPDLPALLLLGSQFSGGGDRAIKNIGKALANAPSKAFDISADFDADLGYGEVRIPQLKVNALGMDADLVLEARRIRSDKPSYKGAISARGADLPLLLRLAGEFEAGKERPLADFGKSLRDAPDKNFDIAAQFDADFDSGAVRVPQLKAHGLGFAIDGRLEAQDVNKASAPIKGELAVVGDRPGPVVRAAGQEPLSEVLQRLTASAGVTGTMNDLALAPLALEATLAGRNIPNSPVKLALGADARANLDEQTLDLKNLSVKGLGLDLEGEVKATGIKDAPAFAGTLAVAPFNLRTLLASLNQEIPETADPKALTRVGLQTSFDGSKTSLKIPRFDLRLDESRAQGELAFASFDPPDVSFGIGIDQIDADRYLAPEDPAKGARPPATPETAAAGASQLPLETLRSLRLKGELVVGQLVLSGAKMSDVRLDIDANKGKIALNPATAKLYQGSYNGNVTLDATGQEALLVLNTQLTGVQAEPLLADVTGKRKLSGTANFAAQLNARGGDVETIKRTVTGQGRFALDNGVYRGLDIAASLRQAEMLLESKNLGSGFQKGQETRFRQVGGTLDVRNGVIRNEDLMVVGDGFRVTGKGMLCNLATDDVKYDIKAAVDRSTATTAQGNFNLGGYGVPIQCRGACSDPACAPDFGEIAKAAAGRKIEEVVGDKLKEQLPGEVGDALKKMLKF
jgi:uncharacterized protein involved in outer membrane biogenesis